MRYYKSLILLFIIYISTSSAQQFSEAIEDNSFFIEEAYNQEDHIVQHISSGFYQHSSKSFIYTFTQEWPVGGQKNQLSYTIPYQSINSEVHGIGDIYINYRYQLWNDENWGWIAPRLSIILPTGKTEDGLGNGVVGFQINLPLSKRWSNEFISHFNLGFTILPNVETTLNNNNKVKKTLPSYFVGTSGIWLLDENINFMCEFLYSINSEFNDLGNVEYSNQVIFSPGIRYAINLGSLQIVPGVAFPITFDSNETNLNFFGYLSFEHPF
jgi:hypothetical protein